MLNWEIVKSIFEKIDGFELVEVPELNDRISRLKLDLNSAGFDPWGMHPETLRKAAPILYWLYKKYFRVETAGIENLPQGRTIFIGNHGGQVPFDAMLAGFA